MDEPVGVLLVAREVAGDKCRSSQKRGRFPGMSLTTCHSWISAGGSQGSNFGVSCAPALVVSIAARGQRHERATRVFPNLDRRFGALGDVDGSSDRRDNFPSVFGDSRPATLSDNVRALAAAIGVPIVLLLVGRGVGWIASGFWKQSP
jgi:hypothetical protein